MKPPRLAQSAEHKSLFVVRCITGVASMIPNSDVITTHICWLAKYTA
jgi:hypothetical protein